MSLSVVGFSAEAITHWVHMCTGIKVILFFIFKCQIQIFRPPSYTGSVILAGFMIIGAIVLYFRKINLELLDNQNFWSSLTMVSLLYLFLRIPFYEFLISIL